MIWRILAILCALASVPYQYTIAMSARDILYGEYVVPWWAAAYVCGAAVGWMIAALLLWDRSHWTRQ